MIEEIDPIAEKWMLEVELNLHPTRAIIEAVRETRAECRAQLAACEKVVEAAKRACNETAWQVRDAAKANLEIAVAALDAAKGTK